MSLSLKKLLNNKFKKNWKAKILLGLSTNGNSLLLLVIQHIRTKILKIFTCVEKIHITLNENRYIRCNICAR